MDEIDGSEDQDIYGKIDALLGKRAGFVNGAVPAAREEDFPVLTDIVPGEALGRDQPAPTPTPGGQPGRVESPGAAPAPIRPGEVMTGEMTLAALEAHLTDLFIRQQRRLEDVVRRVVREELARRDQGRR